MKRKWILLALAVCVLMLACITPYNNPREPSKAERLSDLKEGIWRAWFPKPGRPKFRLHEINAEWSARCIRSYECTNGGMTFQYCMDQAAVICEVTDCSQDGRWHWDDPLVVRCLRSLANAPCPVSSKPHTPPICDALDLKYYPARK